MSSGSQIHLGRPTSYIYDKLWDLALAAFPGWIDRPNARSLTDSLGPFGFPGSNTWQVNFDCSCGFGRSGGGRAVEGSKQTNIQHRMKAPRKWLLVGASNTRKLRPVHGKCKQLMLNRQW